MQRNAELIQSAIESSQNKTTETVSTVNSVERLSLEQFENTWKKFSEQYTDKVTEYAALQSDKLWDEFGSKAIVTLKSKTLYDAFVKLVPQFKEFVHQNTGMNKIEFIPELQEEVSQKTLYTSKEKFEHLLKQVPALKEFVQRLGLDLE
ncbi:MAG: hypothetical protein U0V72_05575 [Cytophagales bacterium]